MTAGHITEDAMSARIGNVSFDCNDVMKLATFWSGVLGRPLDNGSSDRWASIGGSDGARAEPAWYFNKVPEGSWTESTTDSLGPR